MLAVNVRKIKKYMTYSTLPLTQSFFPEWGDFLRSNVMLVSEKHVFFKKKEGMSAYVNVLRHKCLLHGTTYLYS